MLTKTENSNSFYKRSAALDYTTNRTFAALRRAKILNKRLVRGKISSPFFLFSKKINRQLTKLFLLIRLCYI